MNRVVFILLAATVTALLVRQTILSRHQNPVQPQPVTISASTPAPKNIIGTGTALLSKRHDGYYWAKARIGGYHVDFIVDTGAQLVALTRHDADRININVSDSSEIVDVITASGRTSAARVTIPEIVIGSVRLRDVEALVMGEHMAHSLLGMSFFERVSGWEANADTLIIRQ